jgi:hypothetical protein
MAQNDGRREKLLDLRADPGEHTNVAAQRPRVVAEMRRRVRAAAGGKPPYYSDAVIDGPRRG